MILLSIISTCMFASTTLMINKKQTVTTYEGWVVAQLVEWSLLKLETPGLHPVIRKLYFSKLCLWE